VNGQYCKDPKLVTSDDFFFSVKEGVISNPVGSQVTLVTVNEILGLNTLGVSLARIDFAPKGINPPHTHPRATEILMVLNGTLNVGFYTSNQESSTPITKDLNEGDVFVFPIGLIHFEHNTGDGNAVAISGLSSQNPGIIHIIKDTFGFNPKNYSEVLTKGFQMDNNIHSWKSSETI